MTDEKHQKRLKILQIGEEYGHKKARARRPAGRNSNPVSEDFFRTEPAVNDFARHSPVGLGIFWAMAMQALDRQVFGAGKIIFREGDEGAAAYLIERGSVEISKFVHGGKIPIGRLGERGMFGEMALIDNRPRMATATALEETVCVVIAHDDIQIRLRKLDPFIHAVLCILVENVRHQTELRLNRPTAYI